MANRIKDALPPELYNYYKDNRGRYRKYASDISMLKAKLFEGMTADGVFPSYKKTYHYETERKCVEWMDKKYKYLGKHTFDDFRKMFKDILKNYPFKSDEYYQQCERIVRNNQEFESKEKRIDTKTDKTVMLPNLNGKYDFKIEVEKSYGGYSKVCYIVTKNCRASLSNFDSKNKTEFIEYVERQAGISMNVFSLNYSPYLERYAPFSKDYRHQCLAILLENGFEDELSKKNSLPQNSHPHSFFNKNDDKYYYEIITEKSYAGYATLYYIKTKHRYVQVYRYGTPECFDSIESSCGMPFEDFCKKYETYLKGQAKWSAGFYYQCLAIILENGREIRNTKNDKSLDLMDDFVAKIRKATYWYIPLNQKIIDILFSDLMSIVLFFALGGIAYIFKHIIAFIVYILVYLCWLILCIISNILGILFLVDLGEPNLNITTLGSPLRIWQIGGWISGFVVFFILVYSLYQIMEIAFGDKLDKWFRD